MCSNAFRNSSSLSLCVFILLWINKSSIIKSKKYYHVCLLSLGYEQYTTQIIISYQNISHFATKLLKFMKWIISKAITFWHEGFRCSCIMWYMTVSTIQNSASSHTLLCHWICHSSSLCFSFLPMVYYLYRVQLYQMFFSTLHII